MLKAQRSQLWVHVLAWAAVELAAMVLGVHVAYHVTCGMAVQNGATPMYIAAYQGHKKCIEVLAGLGGDVNKAMTVSVQGEAQSVVVASGGVCSVWSWVGVDTYNVTVGVRGCVQNGATPIYIAAQHGHKECIDVLLAAGADKDAAVSLRALRAFFGLWTNVKLLTSAFPPN